MKLDNDLFVRNLQGMCRIPTVSSADPDKIDKEAFLEFHRYLEKAYPLVHKTMTKEIVGRAGLLYHWKGTGKSGNLPLLLTAHQDVVPEGDHSMWTHPPYEAVIADDCIWARGSTDSKCNIQAYMDALELLIAGGFVPDYDIYFAFGYNEEIMGGPEAAGGLLSAELKKRGVQFGLVIDECGGIEKRDDGRLVATIYVCEKGYADFEVSKKEAGGHSATPPPHTSLGVICQVGCIIEDNPFPQKLTQPVIDQLKAGAAFMKDSKLAELCKDPVANWGAIKPIIAEDKKLNALGRTTAAVTMAKGSDQANILPERSVLIVNHRLLPGDTLEDIFEHYKRVIPADAGVEVRLVKGNNPPPVQSTDTAGYRLIKSIVEEKYPGITFVPSMLNGGTDSRWYCELCPTNSVYRFTGLFFDSRWGEAHKTNERIPCDALSGNVEFFAKLFQRYGRAE